MTAGFSSERSIDPDAALRSILESTTGETGQRFFEALVKNVAKALDARGAWVTEYLHAQRRLRALAFWLDGRLVSDYEYDIRGTPCEPVIENATLVHVPDNVIELFPDDPDLKAQRAVSYLGTPLLDTAGKVMGHLAVLDGRPMPDDERLLAVFRIFADRAAAERRRLRSEAGVREREQKLGRLLANAMDAIIEMDSRFKVTLLNRAAEKLFRARPDAVLGTGIDRFFSPDSGARVKRLTEELDRRTDEDPGLWVSGGLEVVLADGGGFAAEATLSRYELDHERYYTLILRNVQDRLEAERRIHTLSMETEYLREEIQSIQAPHGILGRSQAVADLLRSIQEVAATDATVLITGETGTGKELVARAIHAASPRRGRALVKVNCGALPATLIESELFGHEKGAFTGATQKREGRFSLANKGTIFLDEVGELALELQVKLLRVLQEGEFEPLGSSRTVKVDVRVIAATNRNLRKAVEERTFREDFFYRLNVFPIEVPPLRNRRSDITTLADAFARKFSERLGRKVERLSPEAVQHLESYDWPGNVRELENAIERLVITARDGRLDIERALTPEVSRANASGKEPGAEGDAVLTATQMRVLEKRNLLRALEKTRWRISGRGGAADLLGLHPSTLNSRLRALGIQRQRQ